MATWAHMWRFTGVAVGPGMFFFAARWNYKKTWVAIKNETMPSPIRTGSKVSSITSKHARFLETAPGKRRRVRERLFGVVLGGVMRANTFALIMNLSNRLEWPGWIRTCIGQRKTQVQKRKTRIQRRWYFYKGSQKENWQRLNTKQELIILEVHTSHWCKPASDIWEIKFTVEYFGSTLTRETKSKKS